MRLSKIVLSLCFISGFSFYTNAQINEVSPEDTITQEQITPISYPYTVNVIDERDNIPYTIKVEDPEVIKSRLATIQNIMPMVYNESVEYWINYFTQRRPNFTKNMMEQTDVYFPTFEKILKENGMPQELKYLAILESGLNQKAVSRAKAVGLWQFMTFTGKEYGLTINEYVDERMHLEKSTDAACRYLRYLNQRFNDWDLALASYNSGQGRISRAIKKTGLSNYWDLHPHIPKDTRHYVPQFIALAYLMNFGELHGIIPQQKNTRPPLENIYIDSDVDLNILAQMTETSLEDILKYNPHIKASVLPRAKYGYEIAVPPATVAYFNANREAIIDSVSQRNKSTELIVASDAVLASTSQTKLTTDEGAIIIGRPGLKAASTQHNNEDLVAVKRPQKKIHHVKRGEILSRIAAKYDVTPTEIKKWNNKTSSKVLAGERLTIFIPKTEMVKSTSIAARKSSDAVQDPTFYTVRRGDTLWNISQRFDGVTVNDIKKWNNIKGNNVMVGQKIRIGS